MQASALLVSNVYSSDLTKGGLKSESIEPKASERLSIYKEHILKPDLFEYVHIFFFILPFSCVSS